VFYIAGTALKLDFPLANGLDAPINRRSWHWEEPFRFADAPFGVGF